MAERLLILGRFSDLEDGEMRAVEAGGNKILMVRSGDEITAIGAECPHAGGPLAEGVLSGGKVICPWHKASFCVRTGRRLDPPAVDNVQRFPVKIVNGDIILQPDISERAQATVEDKRRFIILGAGAAGFSAAQALREAGFAGGITMVSQETELPYDRTVLSKYFLAGQDIGEKTPLQDESFYAIRKIERRLAKVLAIDPAAKTITLSDGELSYDAALVATGGEVIAPAFPGAELDHVFTLRSWSDAERIIAAAGTARRAVVIGGNFIGMEAAAGLRERGLEVTVVASETAPFEKQLGARIGNVYRRIHEEKGVSFRFSAKVKCLTGNGVLAGVELMDGEILAADLVIAGIGVRPATDFIKQLRREEDHALVVDAQLKLTEGLFAAGDVAAFPSSRSGSEIRVEHWRVAEQHGRIAALNMLGNNERFTAVPYFWTIQYMMRLDYVGHAKGDDELTIRGDLGKHNFVAYYLRDGVVAAAAGMNRDNEMAAVIELMNRRQDWTVDELHPNDATPIDVLQKLTRRH